MNILIVGAGGHGQTIADALQKSFMQGGSDKPVGYLDDTTALHGKTICGVPVLGSLSLLSETHHDALIVGIGDNTARRRIFEEYRSLGFSVTSVVHHTAVIALDVHVGTGCYIGPNAVIGVGSWIGDNVIISGGGCIGHHNTIGHHAHLGPGVNSTRDVMIGEGALVGLGTNLLPGSAVGQWCTVIGGALVSGSLPSHVLAGGVPARVIPRLKETNNREP